MTSRRSKPSSAKQRSASYEIEVFSRENPARSRIAGAWEVLIEAVDELTPQEQILALAEIQRRARDAGISRLRIMKARTQRNPRNANGEHPTS